MKKREDILKGSIPDSLKRMTLPMVFGIVAIMLFSLVDAIYVGHLGTRELAAIGFTFPVAFVVKSIAMGMGVGVGTTVAQLIGKGNHQDVRRFTTDALLLISLIVLAAGIAGYLTIDPLFTLLGATPEILTLIRDYMSIWYMGVALLVIPITGNSAIRATGDTKTPSLIMIAAGGFNALFDPFLIFGIGPFPRLELKGAALATVLSWVIILVGSLWVLIRREKMLDFHFHSLKETLNSWGKALYIGIPTALTNMLNPISVGILIAIISRFGPEGVAAYGAAGRIQPLAMVVIMALASVMPAFIGQNWAAQNFQRVKEGMRISLRFSMIWQTLLAVILAIFAPLIGRAFSQDPVVIRYISLFLWILPVAYGCEGVCVLVSSALNAIHKPIHAAILNTIRLFGLFLPLAYLGSTIWGIPGLFIGASIGNIAAGTISYLWAKKVFGV